MRPEVLQQPAIDLVDPAVQMKFLFPRPRVLNDRCRRQSANLHFDVDFAHPVEPLRRRQRIEDRLMLAVEHRYRLQPMIKQGSALFGEDPLNPAAAVVPAYDNVFDFEMFDREFQN